MLARLAVRVQGHAAILAKNSPRGQELLPHFQALWNPYLEQMQDFVEITIENAQLITSPAYDVGFGRDELVAANLDKLNKLA